MSKNFYRATTCITIVALFSLASCQKEEDGKVLFTGSIEKATVDSTTSINIANNTGTVKWESGDRVAIYDQGASYTLEAIPTSDNTTADFTGDAKPTGGPYYAIYPASIASGSESITLPAEQNCTDGTHFTAPMYAYSTTSNLVFKNLCGVLQLNLPAVNKTIARIELTTPNNNICGDFAIDYNNGDPQLSCTANGGHTLTLNCGEQGMDCSQGLTFYIYLPADDYTEMTFAIEATDRSCCLKHFEDADHPITIDRNTYYPTTFGNLSFIDPAQLVDGEAFSRVMMGHHGLRNLVFEYKSTRPASPNGLLSTPGSPTPIYYTIEGNTMIVYTPAAQMYANPDCSFMFFKTFGGNVEQIDFGTGFNTENVTTMSSMFASCTNLTSLDISGFNTANVTDMSYMFSYCQNLVSLNLSNLNLQSVTTMESMFSRCGVQTLNLSGATTSSALNNATSMFSYCENLFGTLDLTGIELSYIDWRNKVGIFRNTAINGSLTVLCTQNTYNALNDEGHSHYGLAGNSNITLQVVE